MPSGRSIAAFAVKFLVIYGALAASGPLCGPAYALFCRESGNFMFDAVDARNYVHIRAAVPPDAMKDTTLCFHVSPGQTRQVTVSSWVMGFQPISLLIGLVLATPVSARRRLWGLFLGLAMLHAFVLARLATFTILGPVVVSDTSWMNAVRASVIDFIAGYAVSCFVPVLIWVAVTIRREDVRRFVGPTVKKVAA